MVDYIVEGKIVVIVGSSDDEEEIIIPEFIDELPVAKIGANSFNELKNLKRVVFPKTLRQIGGYAFAGCEHLTEVSFSEGLDTIEDWAFISCNIESVDLPTTLRMIGENAFLGNPCKQEINKYLAQKAKSDKKRKTNKNPIGIFPISKIDIAEELTVDVITEKSKYQSSQMLQYDTAKLDIKHLDLPLLFDGDEFLIAFSHKDDLSDFEVKLNTNSRKIVGLYEEDDPDFLVLGVELLASKESIAEFYIKTPYLEDASFEVVEAFSIEEPKNNRYYLHITASLSCFGNGNISREFSMNYFDDLEGKYETQEKNHLITSDELELIKDKIDNIKIETTQDFLKQITGAPLMQYAHELLQAVLLDDDYENKDEIYAYSYNHFKYIYDNLSDFDSLERICFRIDDVINFLTKYTQKNKDELTLKYGIFPHDEENNPLADDKIKLYKDCFNRNDYNYTLHADYLNYIFQVMQQLNNNFTNKIFDAELDYQVEREESNVDIEKMLEEQESINMQEQSIDDSQEELTDEESELLDSIPEAEQEELTDEESELLDSIPEAEQEELTDEESELLDSIPEAEQEELTDEESELLDSIPETEQEELTDEESELLDSIPEAEQEELTEEESELLDSIPEAEQEELTDEESELLDSIPEAEQEELTDEESELLDSIPEAEQEELTDEESELLDSIPEVQNEPEQVKKELTDEDIQALFSDDFEEVDNTNVVDTEEEEDSELDDETIQNLIFGE